MLEFLAKLSALRFAIPMESVVIVPLGFLRPDNLGFVSEPEIFLTLFRMQVVET